MHIEDAMFPNMFMILFFIIIIYKTLKKENHKILKVISVLQTVFVCEEMKVKSIFTKALIKKCNWLNVYA